MNQKYKLHYPLIREKYDILLKQINLSKLKVDTRMSELNHATKELKIEKCNTAYNKKLVSILQSLDRLNILYIQLNLFLEDISKQGDNLEFDVSSSLNNKKESGALKSDNSNNSLLSPFKEKKQNVNDKRVPLISKGKFNKYTEECNNEMENDLFAICQNPATVITETVNSHESPTKVENLKCLPNIENIQQKETKDPFLLPEQSLLYQEKLFFHINDVENSKSTQSVEDIKEKETKEPFSLSEKSLTYQEKCEKFLLSTQKLNKKIKIPSKISLQKQAINLGAPNFAQSKFSLFSKEIKNSNSSSVIVDETKSDIVSLSCKSVSSTDSKIKSIETNISSEKNNIDVNHLVKQSKFEASNRSNLVNNNIIFYPNKSSLKSIPQIDCSTSCKQTILPVNKLSSTNNDDNVKNIKEQNKVQLIDEEKTNSDSNNFNMEEIVEDGQKDSNLTLDKIEESSQIELIEHSTLEIRDNDICMVTYSKSPKCFYVLIATDLIAYYDSFLQEMHSYCENNEAVKFSNKEDAIKITSNNDKAYFCCYNHVEECNFNWFRCIVTDWLLSQADKKDYVRVFAVDEGFEIEVHIDKIRLYHKTNYNLPRLAIKCSLKNVYPFGSTEKNIISEWSEESLEFFKHIVTNSRVNPFIATNIQKIGDTFEIELYSGDQGTSLSNALISMDYGVLIEFPKKYCIKSQQMIEQIKKAQKYSCTSDSEWEDCDDIKENLTQAIADIVEGGLIPKDQTRLCKFTKVDGEKCFKGNMCHFEHRILKSNEWSRDKEKIHTESVKYFHLPEVGTRIILYVTNVLSVCQFYAQLEQRKQNEQSKSVVVSITKQLSQYMKKTENIKNVKKFNILPALSELVLSYNPEDKVWYRSKIVDIFSEDKITLLNIDFGTFEHNKLENLRKMETKFIGSPPQAFLCRIANCDPIEHDYNKNIEIVKHLNKIIYDQHVTAYIIKNYPYLEVNIYTSDGMDVGNFLKAQNYATERNPLYISKNPSLILD